MNMEWLLRLFWKNRAGISTVSKVTLGIYNNEKVQKHNGQHVSTSAGASASGNLTQYTTSTISLSVDLSTALSWLLKMGGALWCFCQPSLIYQMGGAFWCLTDEPCCFRDSRWQRLCLCSNTIPKYHIGAKMSIARFSDINTAQGKDLTGHLEEVVKVK